MRIGNAPTTRDVSDNDEEPALPQVTVFSGVSLGDGLLVTPIFVVKDARVRVTIPGGEQAKAKPLVIDQFCGLALLEMDRRECARY